MKKKINPKDRNLNVYRSINPHLGVDDEPTLGELLIRLTAAVELYGKDAKFKLETNSGPYNCSITEEITWYSPETDEEYERRMERIKTLETSTRLQKKEIEESERKLYEKLKKKYS